MIKDSLTKLGWGYHCVKCEWISIIPSDNIMSKECGACGGDIRDMTKAEAEMINMMYGEDIKDKCHE